MANQVEEKHTSEENQGFRKWKNDRGISQVIRDTDGGTKEIIVCGINPANKEPYILVRTKEGDKEPESRRPTNEELLCFVQVARRKLPDSPHTKRLMSMAAQILQAQKDAKKSEEEKKKLSEQMKEIYS